MTNEQIAAPVAKASAALGAGAGASFLSTATTQAQSFLPTDLSGWLAAGASAAALIYSLTLLTEWWWKRVWRPLFRRLGWVAQPPAPESTLETGR